MNPDEFEKRLQGLPLRKIPTQWREEILQGATATRPSTVKPRGSFISTLRHQLSTSLWLNPKAWAGLAAVWVVVFALQFSSRGHSRMIATAPAPQPSTLLMTLKDQQQTLVELMGNSQPEDADQPRRFSPRPRSERRTYFLMT
jgi:hypothetical protein